MSTTSAPHGGSVTFTVTITNNTNPPANSTAKVSFTTTVSDTANPGTHTLTPNGQLGRETSTFTPDTFTFRITGADADIAVGLSAAPAPLPSSAIDYTQTATNNGPATATSGTVTTTLPSQTAGVTGLPANCTYDDTTKKVACTFADLANAATATNTFTARLNLISLGALPATATPHGQQPCRSQQRQRHRHQVLHRVTGLIITC